MSLDPTHDPGLRSFVDVPAGSDFPIQNLPFGVFTRGEGSSPAVGTRIGDLVLDLTLLESRGLLGALELSGARYFSQGSLNSFMGAGRPAWRAARAALSRLLSAGEPQLRDDAGLRAGALIPVADVRMCLPAHIGDYTDFYSSREHATNVGTMFRGAGNALLPNWVHLPVAYHGRSSSIVVDGQAVRRPRGQTRPDDSAPPVFGPSRALDFELETGFFVGPGNRQGEPIPVDAATEHIFGMVLVNDWSARDIQKWEYQPLGPFLAKNFATSISPWVVTMDALEPFRCDGPRQEPEPLPYLRGGAGGAYDIELEVALQTARGAGPETISRSNFKYLYWSMCQQLAHHTVGGCNVRPGDLMASGTISGPDSDSRGSLLELSWGGKEPLRLGTGEQRTFLLDGDRLVLRGCCRRGELRIGFGEVGGVVLPAND